MGFGTTHLFPVGVSVEAAQGTALSVLGALPLRIHSTSTLGNWHNYVIGGASRPPESIRASVVILFEDLSIASSIRKRS